MKVLIIEDEPSLLRSITEYFEKEDFLCEGVSTYADGIVKIDDYDYDCIILDINLPGGSGLQLLQYLRAGGKEEGVIIISARDSLDDRITGLDSGADDYLVKPFHLSELNARVKSLMRRKYARGADIVSFGDIHFNMPAKTVFAGDKQIILTKYEYELLFFLLTNKNKVVSKRAIAEHMLGEEADNLSSFDVLYTHVRNLKKKLRERGADEVIQTVYGLGYKLVI